MFKRGTESPQIVQLEHQHSLLEVHMMHTQNIPKPTQLWKHNVYVYGSLALGCLSHRQMLAPRCSNCIPSGKNALHVCIHEGVLCHTNRPIHNQLFKRDNMCMRWRVLSTHNNITSSSLSSSTASTSSITSTCCWCGSCSCGCCSCGCCPCGFCC